MILHRCDHQSRRWQRIPPGDVLFLIVGIACLLAAICLTFLPLEKSFGPALIYMYGLPGYIGIEGRAFWALVFGMASVAPLSAAIWPTIGSRFAAYIILLPICSMWTGGTLLPLFGDGPANFWPPLVWGVLTFVGSALFVLVPLESRFYGSLPRG